MACLPNSYLYSMYKFTAIRILYSSVFQPGFREFLAGFPENAISSTMYLKRLGSAKSLDIFERFRDWKKVEKHCSTDT
jgi:hypothetical protein